MASMSCMPLVALATLKLLSTYFQKSKDYCLNLTKNDEYRKMDPNIAGKDGWKALEIACQTGLLEIVQLIIRDSKVKINSTTERGSALHLAVQSQNFKIC